MSIGLIHINGNNATTFLEYLFASALFALQLLYSISASNRFFICVVILYNRFIIVEYSVFTGSIVCKIRYSYLCCRI